MGVFGSLLSFWRDFCNRDSDPWRTGPRWPRTVFWVVLCIVLFLIGAYAKYQFYKAVSKDAAREVQQEGKR